MDEQTTNSCIQLLVALLLLASIISIIIIYSNDDINKHNKNFCKYGVSKDKYCCPHECGTCGGVGCGKKSSEK